MGKFILGLVAGLSMTPTGQKVTKAIFDELGKETKSFLKETGVIEDEQKNQSVEDIGLSNDNKPPVEPKEQSVDSGTSNE